MEGSHLLICLHKKLPLVRNPWRHRTFIFFSCSSRTSASTGDGSQQPKKVRGPTLISDIWDLDKNERAVIEVDPITHIPIGGDDGDLARFIGTMVRMSNLAPIDYLSWLHMPEHMKDEMWRIVESKFKFVPSSNDDTKKWVMKKMNDQWRYWKSDLKSRGFDDSLTEEEMLAKMPDDRVDKDQYKKLVQYWCTEKAKGISSKNKGNCAKYDEPHCLGTRSLQKFIREKTKKANGVTPSRAQIYIGSRTRKDENIVNERATQVMGQVNQPMSSGSSGRGGRTTSGRGGRSARGHRNSTERSMTSHGFRVLVGEETGNTYFRFIHMLLSRGMEWVFNSRT